MANEPSFDESTVARATARLAKVCEIALRDVELSVPQYRLLSYLADGSAAAASLAERLIVSRPSVTTLVDGLVARGLVERQPDPEDRRRVDHLLTPEGRRTLQRADRTVADMLRSLVARLDPVDAERALAGLALVHESLALALEEREFGDRGGSGRPVGEVTAS